MPVSKVKTPKDIWLVISAAGVVRIRQSRQKAVRAAREVQYYDKLVHEPKQLVIQHYTRIDDSEIVKKR